MAVHHLSGAAGVVASIGRHCRDLRSLAEVVMIALDHLWYARFSLRYEMPSGLLIELGESDAAKNSGRVQQDSRGKRASKLLERER